VPSSAELPRTAEEDDTVAKPTMDPLAFLRKAIEEGDPDLLREVVRTFAETLMWVVTRDPRISS